MPDAVIIQYAARTLMRFAWQGLAIALLCGALMTLFRRPSARYAIGCFGLVAMLVMPLVTLVVFARAPQATFIGSTITSDASPTPQINFTPMPSVAIIAAKPQASWRDRLAFAAVACWSVGVAVLGLRHALGLAGIARLRRRATKVIDAALLDRFARIAAALNLRRPIALLSTLDLDAPAVVGWLRPAILWPASLLTGLTPTQLDGLLAHELAHIRRHDYLVNLLQTLVETLGFYHPCVWWLSRRVRQEREHCCDEIAATIVGDRASYARTLVALESLRGPRSLAIGSNGGTLMMRVKRLLMPARSHVAPSPTLLAAILCATILCGTGLYHTARAATQPSTRPTTSPAADQIEADAKQLAKRDLVLASLIFRRDVLDNWIAQADQLGQKPADIEGLRLDREQLTAEMAGRVEEIAHEPLDQNLRYPIDTTFSELSRFTMDASSRLDKELEAMPADAPERPELQATANRAHDAVQRSTIQGTYYLGGRIARVGAYNLPPDGMMLIQAIVSGGGFADQRANVPDDAWIVVTIPCQSDRTKESRVYVQGKELNTPKRRLLYLMPNASIMAGVTPPELHADAAEVDRQKTIAGLNEEIAQLRQRIQALTDNRPRRTRSKRSRPTNRSSRVYSPSVMRSASTWLGSKVSRVRTRRRS